MATTIYASFDDPSIAEKALGALLDHGARPEDISMIRNQPAGAGSMPGQLVTETRTVSENPGSTYGTHTVTTPIEGAGYTEPRSETVSDYSNAPVERVERVETVSDYSNAPVDRVEPVRDYGQIENDRNNPSVVKTEEAGKHGISTTTGADAASGAVTGAAWGIGVGALAALAALFIPGVGLVLGGGALASALGATAATAGAGAAAGALTGYLKDQGVAGHVAEHYEHTVTSGGAVLSVHLPSGSVDEARAREVLDKYNAANVNTMTSGSSGYVS